jgi:hypothetical protein
VERSYKPSTSASEIKNSVARSDFETGTGQCLLKDAKSSIAALDKVRGIQPDDANLQFLRRCGNESMFAPQYVFDLLYFDFQVALGWSGLRGEASEHLA